MKHIPRFLAILFLLLGCQPKMNSSFHSSAIPDFRSEHVVPKYTNVIIVRKPISIIDSFSPSKVFVKKNSNQDTIIKHKAKIKKTGVKVKKGQFQKFKEKQKFEKLSILSGTISSSSLLVFLLGVSVFSGIIEAMLIIGGVLALAGLVLGFISIGKVKRKIIPLWGIIFGFLYFLFVFVLSFLLQIFFLLFFLSLNPF